MSTLKAPVFCLLLLFFPVLSQAEDSKAPPKFYDGLQAEIEKIIQYHTVKPNERLSTIAARYGFSVAELAQWNEIAAPYHITVGQPLKLFNDKTNTSHKILPDTIATSALLEKPLKLPSKIMANPELPEPLSQVEINIPILDNQDSDSEKDYIVKKNDSLYSIALRFKLSAAQLAAWNAVTSAEQLQARQKLVLFDKNQYLKVLNSSKIKEKIRENMEDNSQKTSIISTNNKSMLKLYRQWPTEGKIIKKFSQTNGRGIEISGKVGQAIKAIAAGKVVAVSPGIYGHGGFIVIQHDNLYLSSYTNNRRSLVKNGQVVTPGQVIAEMGQVGRKPPALEFEIRKNGILVDPMWLLPKKM